ncbi:TIGR00159 family protein [Desulfotomaculum arcticum]|uniref:TIGR00159 family protein n=2 Tax=Desulfotruncus TaxID=2867377 RepID=A0A1I2P1K8_9FIRM|nr:TIGR00159 family protein [Desulfotomaculum arcticum] [Desulfotruncus arcticus DSM 17038]
MAISVKDLPQNLDITLKHNFKDLCELAREMQGVIKANRPCEEIFEQFTKIKNTIDYIESLILTSQLKNCFLPDIPYMKELFKAIQHLSIKGYGALIAIQREDDIKEVIDVTHIGVQLDAKLSNRLLESIFYPGSPLHDGAVVIKGDRIFSAGCVLPLSKKVVPEKKLGTRHMAALGLSEICDAVIFVVSEETRKITIAFKGELFTNIHKGKHLHF